MNKKLKNTKEVFGKDAKFESIEIATADRQRLFNLAMRIKEHNGQREPMFPFSILHFAIDALEEEVNHYIGDATEVSSKTLN